MGFGAKAPWERKTNTSAVTKADVAQVSARFPVKTADLADDAVTAAKAAPGVVNGDTITDATLQTAATGERIVIRNDGSGGIIESYSGLSGETPGSFDPAAIGAVPSITIKTGTTATHTEASSIIMGSNPANGSKLVLQAGDIQVRGLSGAPALEFTNGVTKQAVFDSLYQIVNSGTGFGAGFSSSLNTITGGNMAVTSTHTNIPGLSQTITSPGTGAAWCVSFNGWLLTGTTGYTVLIELLVDAVAQTALAIQSGSTTGSTCSQQWRITGLSAGNHTLVCRAYTNAPGETGTVAGTHATMMIQRQE